MTTIGRKLPMHSAHFARGEVDNLFWPELGATLTHDKHKGL